MIKKLLKRLFNEKDVECSVDKDEVDCEHLDDDQEKAYTGIPAPILNPVDDWFSGPYGAPTAITEKQQEYQEATERLHEELRNESGTIESADIHQEMYDLATKGGKTTTQLDPIGGSENFQGGSENIQG